MRITRQQLNKLLEGIATAHYQIHTYGWGDVPDLLAREDIIYPFMMVTPQASVYGINTIDHTYTISIADRVLKDKENEVAVDSDTHEILMHVVTQLDNLLYDDVDLIKGVSVTPFFDNFRHEVTGHFANVTVQVMYNYDACAVPSDNVPLPIPPPSDCADATYIVRFEDGTPIETGTIPSGGTKTIEVPNCPPSGTVEWELRDTDGVLIDSGSQNAGDPLTIVAPNGAVTITDSDGATLYVVNVTSGGAETQAIGDSSVEVRNSLNAVVDSGVVKAQGSGVFNAPDATFSINSVAVRTAPSDGSASIQVRQENTSTQVGSLQGQFWRVGDSTVNVRKSDATLIQAVTVAAEDTESVNVADSTAVLKDTAANVISSTNIKATESEDIVAPDGSLQNSDASATLTVRSGEVNKPIADINVEVNTVVEGSIPAIKDVKILITDGVNPVTPDDVSVVGDTVTVEVPSGGGTFDVDLVDRFGNAFPTKQVTANATWDLRTLTPFDFADIFLNTLTGTYTAGEEQAIIDAVDSWVLAGIWQRRRAIFPFVGANAFDNSLNLKYPFDNESSNRLTFIGSPTHDSNGITYSAGNGAYFNLLRTHLPLQDLNMFFYSRTNSLVAGAGTDIALNAAPQTYFGVRDAGSDRVLFGGNGAISTAGTVADSRGGFHGNYISGVNASKAIKNGNTASPLSTLTNGTAFSAGQFSMNILFPTNRNYAGVAVGLSLTDTQMQDDYDIWQQFQTDFNGRQV
jgi:hypothetical protein